MPTLPPDETLPPPDNHPRKKQGGPRPGAGRPRKTTAPRSEDQAVIAMVVQRDEADLAAAHERFKREGTVAAELAWVFAQMAVASSKATYCRAQNNLTHALQYQSLLPKLLRSTAALRELLATDLLAELQKRGQREDALDGARRGH